MRSFIRHVTVSKRVWKGETVPMRWKGKRIGLALGGGGARGLAHIGVMRVLKREKSHRYHSGHQQRRPDRGGVCQRNNSRRDGTEDR